MRDERDPLFDDLLELRQARDRANADIDRQEAQVIAMLRAKYTWQAIADELGVTRQAAWERYGAKADGD